MGGKFIFEGMIRVEQKLNYEGMRVYDDKENLRVHGGYEPGQFGIKITGGEIYAGKVSVNGDANPGKKEAISQTLNELGFGRDGVDISETIFNMAEKIAELCYEVKQIKENGAKIKIDPGKIEAQLSLDFTGLTMQAEALSDAIGNFAGQLKGIHKSNM